MTHYIALDIGGTKTTIGILNASNLNVIYRTTVQTEVGLIEFPKFIGRAIKTVLKIAHKRRIIVEDDIVMGVPGNFKPGGQIIVKEGSGQQLIKKNEKFKDLNITEWITDEFPSGYSIIAINDALAQAIGGLKAHWRDDYKNRVMIYIGPGTGLGGAVLNIGDDPYDIGIIADGHIYDIMVDIRGQQWMAEDVLSGRGILENTGQVAKELNERDDYWNQHQGAVHDCGDCIRSIVMNIRNKSVIKLCENNHWNDEDQDIASKLSVILLGGSIGTKGRLGQYLYEQCTQLPGIDVIQPNDPESNALIGAVMMKKIVTLSGL